MYIFGFIASLIIMSNLKNKYRIEAFDNPFIYIFTLLMMSSIASVALPFLIFIYIVLKCSGVLDSSKRRSDRNKANRLNSAYNGAYANWDSWNDPKAAKKAASKANPNLFMDLELPKKQSKRVSIIQKFNKQYNLNLTQKNIEIIAAATYFSRQWAEEVYDMTQKYDSIYEWLGKRHSYLRAYLLAFNVMGIASVFDKQEEYIYYTFDNIFSDICTDEKIPTEVIIENINHKYLTNFDEATFRLAMDYMESKGKKYKYGAPVLQNSNQEMEDLMRKYRTTK